MNAEKLKVKKLCSFEISMAILTSVGNNALPVQVTDVEKAILQREMRYNMGKKESINQNKNGNIVHFVPESGCHPKI